MSLSGCVVVLVIFVLENWGCVRTDIAEVRTAVDQLVKRMVFAVHLLEMGLVSRKILLVPGRSTPIGPW